MSRFALTNTGSTSLMAKHKRVKVDRRDLVIRPLFHLTSLKNHTVTSIPSEFRHNSPKLPFEWPMTMRCTLVWVVTRRTLTGWGYTLQGFRCFVLHFVIRSAQNGNMYTQNLFFAQVRNNMGENYCSWQPITHLDKDDSGNRSTRNLKGTIQIQA